MSQEWAVTGRSLGAEVACSWQRAPGGGSGCLIWEGSSQGAPASRTQHRPAGHEGSPRGPADTELMVVAAPVGRGGGKEPELGGCTG